MCVGERVGSIIYLNTCLLLNLLLRHSMLSLCNIFVPSNCIIPEIYLKIFCTTKLQQIHFNFNYFYSLYETDNAVKFNLLKCSS